MRFNMGRDRNACNLPPERRFPTARIQPYWLVVASDPCQNFPSHISHSGWHAVLHRSIHQWANYSYNTDGYRDNFMCDHEF
jgi:hypothetical protein